MKMEYTVGQIMKVDDLKDGTVYWCRLSERTVLVKQQAGNMVGIFFNQVNGEYEEMKPEDNQLCGIGVREK